MSFSAAWNLLHGSNNDAAINISEDENRILFVGVCAGLIDSELVDEVTMSDTTVFNTYQQLVFDLALIIGGPDAHNSVVHNRLEWSRWRDDDSVE